MKIFLIIVAVLVVLNAIILSLSATLTVIYDKGWTTKVNVLWFEWDIELTKILDFLLFPKENAEMVSEQKKAEKAKKKDTAAEEKAKPEEIQPEEPPQTQESPVDEKKSDETITITSAQELEEAVSAAPSKPETPSVEEKKPKKEKAQKPAKPNFIKSIWEKEGIVGILSFVTNLIETANSAVITFFRGFHIYSLYVKIIVGGGDAFDVADSFGTVCKYYYPCKGFILNGMRVDYYDDLIMPDFIAPGSEYGLQFIGSVNVGLLLRVALSAGKTFLINLIKNK